MKRFTKTLALALAGLGAVSTLALDAEACGPKGRSGGYGGHYRQQKVVYVQPAPVCYQPKPVVRHPQYPPMNVQVHGQQIHGQQFQGQQVQGRQPVGGMPVGSVGGFSGGSASAVGALGGQQIQGQQVQGQPIQGQQLQTQQVSTQQVQGQQLQSGAVAQQGVASQAPAANVQPQAAAPTSVQQSALEALGGFGGGEQAQPEGQPVAASASPTALPVGQFVATMSSGTTVRLAVGADGAFTWTATANGKTSNFQGTFSIQNGSFTLARSNDNQKLEGGFTPTADGFSLKLSGQTDAGLNFVRA